MHFYSYPYRALGPANRGCKLHEVNYSHMKIKTEKQVWLISLVVAKEASDITCFFEYSFLDKVLGKTSGIWKETPTPPSDKYIFFIQSYSYLKWKDSDFASTCRNNVCANSEGKVNFLCWQNIVYSWKCVSNTLTVNQLANQTFGSSKIPLLRSLFLKIFRVEIAIAIVYS